MACGTCRKTQVNKDCKYIYTDSKGQQQVFATEIRAMAAKTKDLHQGSIRVECS